MIKHKELFLLGAAFLMAGAAPTMTHATVAPADVGTTIPADDDDNEGLWGLLGLLGLAGLLGRKRHARDEYRGTTTGSTGNRL